MIAFYLTIRTEFRENGVVFPYFDASEENMLIGKNQI